MKLCYGNFKKKLNKEETLALLKRYKETFDKDVQKAIAFAVLPEYFAEAQKAKNCDVMQQNIKLEDIDKKVAGKRILIGHSDYRVGEGESISLVNKKLDALIANGAKVLLCRGDSKEHYDQGISLQHVVSQLKYATKHDSEELIVAYEPIYAIGGTVAADVNDVMPIIKAIKRK